MNTPRHLRVTKKWDEFLVEAPCSARDLWDAVNVVEKWISDNRPAIAGTDDAYYVEARADVIAFVLCPDYEGAESVQ